MLKLVYQVSFYNYHYLGSSYHILLSDGAVGYFLRTTSRLLPQTLRLHHVKINAGGSTPGESHLPVYQARLKKVGGLDSTHTNRRESGCNNQA